MEGMRRKEERKAGEKKDNDRYKERRDKGKYRRKGRR